MEENSFGVIYRLHYGKWRIAILKLKPVRFPLCKTLNGHFPFYREFGTSESRENNVVTFFPNNFQRKKRQKKTFIERKLERKTG
jgi:hypothetical protein